MQRNGERRLVIHRHLRMNKIGNNINTFELPITKDATRSEFLAKKGLQHIAMQRYSIKIFSNV